jgi:cytochrome c5
VSKIEGTDTHFFNSFSLVLGILIFVAILIFAFARGVGAANQVTNQLSEPLRLEALHENISPVAQVAIAGKDNSALTAMAAPAAPAMAIPASGEAAFTAVCSSCHATGVAGAPKIGDHAAWGPRIAQGKDTLYAHALAGKGAMPPRGGTSWPDATIRSAVDYMVSLNK